ncbi:hypothetical protein [Aquabacterium sp.]|uniref:hypothetical protein n=1 Tax=Aquabacterium sp. TaxID=1872578 RepID=UPI0024878D79|nr:hypothetical protein [Aquabacterium sp.]MDI1260192.1 hypothetical protein [Aquabacterium sp.]
MNGFAFRKHAIFDWKGARFRIANLAPDDDLVVESLSTGAISVVPRSDLLAAYTAGELSAAPEASIEGNSVRSYSRPLDELPEVVRSMANRRHHYLQALYAEGPPKFTRDYLAPIISNAAKAANDTSPPSSITVYRWHRRYQRAKDARALIPRYDRRGSKHSKQSDIVLNLVAEAVTDAFRASPLATGADIHSRVLAKIERENQSRIGGDRLKAPALRTTYRLLRRASSYELCALREGKAAADRRFRIIKAGVQTTRILERVEVDHTPLDLFLLDETTWLPLGRPTLTMAIDHFSRMPLGYYLSFGAPSAAAVVGALRHAVLHKTSAQAVPALVHAENAWICYGVPE